MSSHPRKPSGATGPSTGYGEISTGVVSTRSIAERNCAMSSGKMSAKGAAAWLIQRFTDQAACGPSALAGADERRGNITGSTYARYTVCSSG
jgi:hypothetical protein